MEHFRQITVPFDDPNNFEDSTEVYESDRKDHDHEDECTGECSVTQAFVADCSSVRCVYCGRKT